MKIKGSSFSRDLFAYLTLLAALLAANPPLAAPETKSVDDVSIESLLNRLSLKQKVAQMIQGEIAHVSPDDLRRYGLGSVLNGGGSFPNGNKHATASDWQALADDYYRASIDTSAGNAGIPVVWGTDAVHGHNNVKGATLFPHNIGLGATRNPQLVADIARATAKEVKATGIDWIFAPTVAVATDFRWGRTYESYSSDPAVVASYAGDMVSALQAEGLAATAKHFIGDGGTYKGTDRGDTRLPLQQLVARHGAGYPPAIDAGVMAVMASFNSWNGEKVHGDHRILTDVLRGQLGFDGLIVSDWNGIGEVSGCTVDSCAKAINAGIDMIMVPEDWLATLNNIVSQVESGEISRERIDDAVRRILRFKAQAGVLDRGLPSVRAAEYADSIGSSEHRAIARQAVRESLVLLKNEHQLLPLDPRGKFLVVGSAADDIGTQSGGWTISWQGTGNANTDFPGGSSILMGLREQIEAAGGELFTEDTLPEDVSIDAVIAVYGERPYAEGQGDRMTLSYQTESGEDIALLRHYRQQDLPVVSVLITGRPLWINAELNASDSFVVAWLPGTEGGGVADLLLADARGEQQYQFTGVLPMPWPKTDLNPANHALPVANSLFPLGYGLSTTDNATVAELDEQALSRPENIDRPVFAGGEKGPWRLYLGDELDWAVPSGPRGGSTKGNFLDVRVMDYRVQEDARSLRWSSSGVKGSQAYFRSDDAIDMTELLEAGGAMVLEIKVNRAPEKAVTLRMDCTWPCRGEVDFTNELNRIAKGQWRRIAVPLSCFARAGASMSSIDVPFLLSTSGALDLDLAEVTIAENPRAIELVNCTATDIAENG